MRGGLELGELIAMFACQSADRQLASQDHTKGLSRSSHNTLHAPSYLSRALYLVYSIVTMICVMLALLL